MDEAGMSDQERWLPVLGYEGLYEVSDQGRVRSNDRQVRSYHKQGYRNIKGQLLNPQNGPNGYLTVTLCRGDSGRTKYIHRIVLEAFVGPCPDGLESCHESGIKSDVTLGNLRWDTRSENQRDFERRGRVRKEHVDECPRGHLLQIPNLLASGLRKGLRGCRACNNRRHVQKVSWTEFLLSADDRYRTITGLEPNLTAPGRSPKVAI